MSSGTSRNAKICARSSALPTASSRCAIRISMISPFVTPLCLNGGLELLKMYISSPNGVSTGTLVVTMCIVLAPKGNPPPSVPRFPRRGKHLLQLHSEALLRTDVEGFELFTAPVTETDHHII